MKKWIIQIIVVLGLVVALIIAIGKAGDADKKWKLAEANMKAYDSQLGEEIAKSTAFKLSVEQLEYFKDSILKKLDETRKELGIKDKNLKALQHIASSFSKTDTIRIDSIIFKEPSFSLDTIVGDEWYSVQLGLEYPSMIVVKPEFKSEKDVVVSTERETVNPPKKCWLLRLFQKKHDVTKVEVVEKNPHVTGETSKYVEIIK